MCLIVDANRLGDFLVEPPKDDVQPIRRWLASGGKIVYATGGKFADEIGARARARLAELDRSGRAIYVPDADFEPMVEQLEGRVRSDDPHVLALARSSGARVLYAHDQALIDDFTDKDIISRPRGRVYVGASNSDLLERWATCK